MQVLFIFHVIGPTLEVIIAHGKYLIKLNLTFYILRYMLFFQVLFLVFLVILLLSILYEVSEFIEVISIQLSIFRVERTNNFIWGIVDQF